MSGAAGYERDSYLCRSLIAQRKFKQAKSIFDSSKTATQFLAVKQLCLYQQACISNSLEEKELVIDTLKTILDEEQESVTDNNTFCIISAQIFIEEKNYKQALSLLQVNKSKSLEKLSHQEKQNTPTTKHKKTTNCHSPLLIIIENGKLYGELNVKKWFDYPCTIDCDGQSFFFFFCFCFCFC